MLASLQTTHERIAGVFKYLASSREAVPGTVYFCEHGLADEEISALKLQLKSAFDEYSIDHVLSFSTYLTLIACATEVGYQYQGNGTDFWPALGRTIGHNFDFTGRTQLSSWFETAARLYRGAVPGESDWESAFCHIAWPITHAVAARDIRRPFADSLRRFRGSADDDDSTIIQRLTSVEPVMGSRRYRTWLMNQSLVAGIVRDLLRGPSLVDAGLLSKEFRDRLIADLTSEPEISLAIRIAQRNRNRSQRGKTDSDRAGKEADGSAAILGSFFLRRATHDEFELLGRLPEMPKPMRQTLTQLHRSRRWQPRAWGFGNSALLPRGAVTARQGTFLVELRSVQRISVDNHFFTGTEELDVDSETKKWLRSVRFPGLKRIAFKPIENSDDVSEAITSRAPRQGSIWVAHSDTDPIPVVDAETVGQLTGGNIHRLDAADPRVRAWLGWPETDSISSHDTDWVKFVAPSAVSSTSNGLPVFSLGDVIAIETSFDEATAFTLSHGGNKIGEHFGGGLAVIDVTEPGVYELQIRKDTAPAQSIPFEFVADVETDAERPWEANLARVDGAEESGLTRRDLFNGRLMLEIVGPRAVENLPILFSISPGPCEVVLQADKLPIRIPASHDVWRQLVSQLPEVTLSSSCDLELTVSVAGISTDSWRLEADSARVWWESSPGVPRAVSDAGEFRVESLTLATNEIVNEATALGEPIVSVAIDGEGKPLTFDARVWIRGESSWWPAQLQKPDRLLRELYDQGTGIGLWTLVSRYLRLAAASSNSKVTELHRVGIASQIREWIVEVCCGDRWTYRRKEHGSIESNTPVEVWWKEQHKFEVTLPARTEKDEPCPQILPDGYADRFNACLPYRWWDGSVLEVSADDAAPLDSLYSQLLNNKRIYTDSEALHKSLEISSRILNGSHLADLIIPISGSDELMAWPLTDVTTAELSQGLMDWTRKHLDVGRGRQRWSTEEIHDWLTLLLYPEQLRKRPWESTLVKLLADRPVARAVTFVAWRVEQIARIQSHSFGQVRD